MSAVFYNGTHSLAEPILTLIRNGLSLSVASDPLMLGMDRRP
jgi:hypothetical protein